MLASELIKCLQIQIEQYGDLPVMNKEVDEFSNDVIFKEDEYMGSICCCTTVINGLCNECKEPSDELPVEYFYIEYI